MHPAVILIPALALIVGPRWWVGHVLRQHDEEDERLPASANEMARELLDRHELYAVAVEPTDLGDHYDPEVKVVRLARERFDRKSLTAVTVAAHEVAHALQHASAYPLFEWRLRLASVARVAGLAGGALLLAAPLSVLLTRRSLLPPRVIGTTALGMLGTGVAAQLAALPTELDASFNRALPMLKDGYIDASQAPGAQRILIASSVTYVASSLVGMLHIWPWLGRGRVFLLPERGGRSAGLDEGHDRPRRVPGPGRGHARADRRSVRGGAFETTVRRVAKPLIRRWLRGSRS